MQMPCPQSELAEGKTEDKTRTVPFSTAPWYLKVCSFKIVSLPEMHDILGLAQVVIWPDFNFNITAPEKSAWIHQAKSVLSVICILGAYTFPL